MAAPIDLMAVRPQADAATRLARGATPGAAARGEAASGGFADTLGRLIEGVEETTAEANGAVGQMLDKTGDVHDAMIALHHAETALQLTVQIRNKLVHAYQEIMRMPV
jgi:flagellar hook-basal body complex protein FliE